MIEVCEWCLLEHEVEDETCPVCQCDCGICNYYAHCWGAGAQHIVFCNSIHNKYRGWEWRHAPLVESTPKPA